MTTRSCTNSKARHAIARQAVHLAFLLALAMAVVGVLTAPTAAAETALAKPQMLPRFVTQPSAQISCDDTPFGTRVTLGREAEFVDMATTIDDGNLGATRELHFSQFGHDSGTSTPWINVDMVATGLGAGALFDIVGVDLNGDGREEAVVASALASGVRLDVLGFDGDHGVVLTDTWLGDTGLVKDVKLLSGDLNGSADGRQEVGMLVKLNDTTSSIDSVAVYVFDGTDTGTIAQADNTNAGYWLLPEQVGMVDAAAGDVLLDGQEQIVIAYIDNTDDGFVLHYHLLEYATELLAQLPITAGNTNIGSKAFVDPLENGVAFDDGGAEQPEHFERISLSIGNLVDSAAAEIVTFMGYVRDNSEFDIAMRMQHFHTMRDADNHITGIDVATRAIDQPFDSTVRAGTWQTGNVGYDGTIANVELAL